MEPEPKPDLFAREVQEDLPSAYRVLRERCPMYREPRYGNCVVTRYEDVRRLREAEFFSAEDGVDPAGKFSKDTYRDLERTDPPRHTALRRLLTDGFGPRAIREREPEIRAIFREHFDAIEGDRCDIIDAVCYSAPAAVVCELMDFPRSARDDFRRWSKALVARLGNRITEEQRQDLIAMARFIRARAAERAAAPGDDLLSALVTGEVDGQPLSDQEIVAHGVFFLAAGHETTANLLGSFTALLCEKPALYRQLAEDRSLIPAAIEETLRLESPVQNICRTVKVANAWLGELLAPDDRVMFSLGGANRDGSRFPEPDDFRLDRKNARHHVAFGYGHHSCLGAHLARLEAQIYADELLGRFAEIRLAGRAERWPSTVMRGYEALDIELVRR